MVYFRGKEIIRDLGTDLRNLRYDVDEVICYRKLPSKLSEEIIEMIENKLIFGGTFFSIQTVDLFFSFVRYIPDNFIAFCISQEVSRKVLTYYPNSRVHIRVARNPTMTEMLKLVVAASDFAD